jgi:hypothetical protein
VQKGLTKKGTKLAKFQDSEDMVPLSGATVRTQILQQISALEARQLVAWGARGEGPAPFLSAPCCSIRNEFPCGGQLVADQ